MILNDYDKNLVYAEKFIEGFYKKKQSDNFIKYVHVKFSLCSDQITKMVIFSVQDSKHPTRSSQGYVISLNQNYSDFIHQMKSSYQTYCLKSKFWCLQSSM